jgi:ABC-2 type transport system ATP-binding protein
LQSSDGVTVVLTTHLLDEAEKCDRLVIVDRGRLVACGTPEALRSEIGGDVILIDSSEPEGLRDKLQQRFAVDASVVGGRVRFEHPDGHEFVPQLAAAFPGEMGAVRVSKPTLEDVFVRRTGHEFSTDGPATDRAR